MNEGHSFKAARVLAILGLVGLLVWPAVQIVKYADRVWLGECLKDAFAAAWWRERWEAAPLLPEGLDYTWLQVADHPIHIAHALGASGTPRANTLAALADSVAAGFRLVEVDLWLDESTGIVHCHHGPAPPIAGSGECTINTLIATLKENPLWLVLDIKTDFEKTGQIIITAMTNAGLERRSILQIYLPEQLGVYVTWRRHYALPGPLITAYRSHRSLNYLARQARRTGVRALTVPIERSKALWSRPDGLRLFVHPVHDCADWAQSLAVHADGVYSLSELRCN
jgi:hypothetical protein